jgi:putative holliday junction resolvase
VILGIDPGERRVGVAIADLETRFARPLEVIDTKKTDALERIGELVTEHDVTRIVVGLAVGLSGLEGPAADASRSFAQRLRTASPVEVVEHDERLTTVIAEQGMRTAGAGAKARSGMRDSVAAQVMLQSYLDSSDE